MNWAGSCERGGVPTAARRAEPRVCHTPAEPPPCHTATATAPLPVLTSQEMDKGAGERNDA